MADPDRGATPEKGNLSPEDIAEFKRRASELGTRIDSVQAEKQAEIEEQQDRANRSRGMAYGLRMSTELVAAILVGGFMGYMLDTLLGTLPWLSLVFLMLGFTAGILNILRTFKRMQDEIEAQKDFKLGQSAPDDDEDGR
jgi:ATP synthase protein I